MSTQKKSDFQLISTRLKAIMQKHISDRIQVRSDKPDQVEFIGSPTPFSHNKEMWIGAVRIGKRYVSYHLMAIYMFPDLLQWISPELKKRMQGKSCFNFTRVDERLFRELDEQTKRVFERFKDSGSIS
jgi:hypothetical protein